MHWNSIGGWDCLFFVTDPREQVFLRFRILKSECESSSDGIWDQLFLTYHKSWWIGFKMEMSFVNACTGRWGWDTLWAGRGDHHRVDWWDIADWLSKGGAAGWNGLVLPHERYTNTGYLAVGADLKDSLHWEKAHGPSTEYSPVMWRPSWDLRWCIRGPTRFRAQHSKSCHRWGVQDSCQAWLLRKGHHLGGPNRVTLLWSCHNRGQDKISNSTSQRG